MGVNADWTTGIPDAAASVSCGDALHTLAWHRGELVAVDHPDPEAERALTALGGPPCACIELLDAWARHSADPRVLVLGPRGAELSPRPFSGAAGGQQRGMLSARGVPRARRPGSVGPSVSSSAVASVNLVHASASSVSGGGPDEDGGDPLGRLLALGGGLPRRLVASAAANLADRVDDPDLRPLLHAALYGRVLAAVSLWLGEPADLELELLGPGGAATMRREDDVICAALPFDWLIDVWARDLATVWGRFVLTVSPESRSTGWDLLCVDPAMGVNSCTLLPR